MEGFNFGILRDFDTVVMKLCFNVLMKSIFGFCFPNYAKET